MVRKGFIIVILIISSLKVNCQELMCNVQVITQQIQGTNKQIFQTLQTAIYEFLNNTSWTNHLYDVDERIECNMLFNLQEQIGDDQFKGTLQIQVRRPVFNSSLNTVLFNYVDNDLHFEYVEFQPLEFSETSHISSLMSTLKLWI